MKRLLISLVSLALMTGISLAQVDRNVTIKLDHVSVKEALSRVLAPEQRTIRVKPEVKATITLTAEREPLSEVLYQIMRQAHAIYDFDPEEGVYDVRPIASAGQTKPGIVFPEDKIVAVVDYDFVDVRLAIEDLLGGKVKYTFPPELKGTVTVNLRNVSLKTALLNLLYQVDYRFRMTGNGIEFMTLEDYKKLIDGPPPPQL